MSASGSSSSQPNQVMCNCGMPSRTCISKTKEHPNKKFRVCPNSLKPGKKCNFWEWVEDGEKMKMNLEDDLIAMKEELEILKKDVNLLKKKSSHRIKISCNLL
ncbi:hypothetical protein LXL04_025759 [Taraxacum kok-saghyz]